MFVFYILSLSFSVFWLCNFFDSVILTDYDLLHFYWIKKFRLRVFFLSSRFIIVSWSLSAANNNDDWSYLFLESELMSFFASSCMIKSSANCVTRASEKSVNSKCWSQWETWEIYKEFSVRFKLENFTDHVIDDINKISD